MLAIVTWSQPSDSLTECLISQLCFNLLLRFVSDVKLSVLVRPFIPIITVLPPSTSTPPVKST